MSKREKKPTIVKLSRQLKNQLLSFDKDDNSESIGGLRDEDMHNISTAEIDRINDTKSDKSYYEEQDIDRNYNKYRNFLCDLRSNSNFDIESLSNEQMGTLVDAVSFSLNGIHYFQKFKKQKSMIQPLDILYILHKLK